MPGYAIQPSECRSLWQVKCDALFSFRVWGEECLVYNELSGHTHLLDTLAAEVLFILKEQPLDFHDLTGQLQEEINPPISTTDLKQYLNKLLPELQRAELLE